MNLKPGDWVIVRSVPKRFEIHGKVLAATETLTIIQDQIGFSTHIRYDAGLGDWTFTGQRVQIEKDKQR